MDNRAERRKRARLDKGRFPGWMRRATVAIGAVALFVAVSIAVMAVL